MFVRYASSFALITALALAAPSVSLADTKPVAAQVESTPAPTRGVEARDYAQRDSKDTTVDNFRGGSTVVIAMSGGVFVVLLLLLLLF